LEAPVLDGVVFAEPEALLLVSAGLAAAGFAAVFLAAVAAGFAVGTSSAAQAAMAKKPTASARLVASAVDRNVPARAERITEVLCGAESSDRSGP